MSNHTCSDRPLPTCKTSIVVTATIFTLYKANIQRWRPAAATTKEVPRPSAAPLLLWFPLYWLWIGWISQQSPQYLSCMSVWLDIMFLAIRASFFLAVPAMHAIIIFCHFPGLLLNQIDSPMSYGPKNFITDRIRSMDSRQTWRVNAAQWSSR